MVKMSVKFSAATERQAPPDPHRLQLRALADKAQLGAVDVAKGRITGVSLLTANREASGHGVWIDQKTLETFQTQLANRRLKAYATHGAWNGDGTLDEVGFWESVRIEGQQLREDFQALEAWRKHEVAEFDTLFELADKLPQEFGASLSFRMTLCWVAKDGREIPTVRKWRETGAWNWETYFDPAMPADAERDMPSVRCVEVYSADFVCVPAANDGLFRAAGVDASGKDTKPASNSAPIAMLKQLNSKFGANPAQLQRAIALHLENDQATFAEIVGRVEGEAVQAELSTLRTEHGSFKTALGLVETAGFKAADGKSAVEVLLADHASLKIKAAAHDASIASLKAAGFEPKDGKSPVELALAANKKLTADIATLKAGGTVPVDTGSKQGEQPAGTAQLSGLAKTKASFAAKFTAQKPANN